MPLRRIALIAIATCFAACGGDRATAPDPDLRPSCAAPAPLLGVYDSRAPGYIISVRSGNDVVATADRLATTLHFTVRHEYTIIPAFYTIDASFAAIAALRCDAAVERVEHDGIGTVAD